MSTFLRKLAPRFIKNFLAKFYFKKWFETGEDKYLILHDFWADEEK